MAFAEPPSAGAENLPREEVSSAPRKHTAYAGDVLKLVSGTTIAQAIAVLLSPLLTRLYAPSVFGTLALFSSITSIIGVVTCLRYEMAIMLPKADEEAANLLAVSLLAVVAITALSVPIVILVRPVLPRLLKAPELGPILWLVPVTVFLGGVFTALNYWNSRTKHFGRLSLVRIVGAVSNYTATLVAGFAGYATAGMYLGGTLLGSVISTGMLTRRIWRDDRALFRASIRLSRMREGLARYRRFPLIDVWSTLLNQISWQLPAFMLSSFFSTTIVGYYSLGLRLLQLPMSLVGGAIGQVFFQRASVAKSQGTLGQTVESTLRNLFTISFFPVLTLAITGRSVFTFVFGSNWAEAGVYSQILAPWVFIWFISGPLHSLFSVMERQDLMLLLNVLILSTRALSLVGGGLLGSARIALALFSLSGIIVYGYALFAALKVSSCQFKFRWSILDLHLVDYIDIVILVIAVFIGLPSAFITVIWLLACLVYFGRIVWREPWFRRFFISIRATRHS